MPSGQTYIVAKTGFLLAAVILPYQVITAEFMGMLKWLTDECNNTLQLNEYRKAGVERQQPKQTMFLGQKIDPETGELLEENTGEGGEDNEAV